MNRTTIFISLIAASTLIITSALLVSDISDNVHPVTGDEFTYTLEFSETKNKPTLESDTGNTGSYTVYTDLGNPIQFDYSDVSEFTLGFLGMPAGASFSNPYLEDVANHNQISGIQTISIVSTGDLILYYGYGSEINEGIYFDSLAITSGETIDIDNASYFTLKNEGEVEIGITSISIVYSCFAVDKEMNLDALTFKLNSEETGYIVSDCDTSIFGEVIIPTVYNGLPVLEIGDHAFSSCASLTSVNIPDSVTTIGKSAFGGCSSLTSVNIPDSVTTIGEGAFSYCYSLTSVNIPDSVTTIGGYAFSYCSFLTSVNIPDSVTTIGESAFSYCSCLTSIYIPDSVTTIGESAFYECSNLTIYCEASSAPSGWDSSWDYHCPVVWNCISSFEISDEGLHFVVVLGKNGDKYITIIGYTGSSTNVVIPSSINVNGEDIPVKAIASNAFYYNDTITSITIPDSVTTIGSYAFKRCSNLAAVTFGENSQLTSIGYSAFSYCSFLTSVNIPDSVTTIGSHAFEGCSSLTSIYIPDSVTTIEIYAFYGCTNLTIYCQASSEPSGWDSWWNSSDRPVVWGFEDCGITVDGIRYAVSIDEENVKYITIIGYTGSSTNVVIPSSINVNGEDIPVKAIANNAFYDNNTIASIIIPDSVTTIGERAFSGCSSLTSVNIPDSVTTIGERAFYECSNLTIYCEASSEPSGWDSWWNSSNRPVVWSSNGLYGEYNGFIYGVSIDSEGNPYITITGYTGSSTNVVIPSSINVDGEDIPIKAIARKVFYYNDTITSITIPDSVTTIGEYAFYSCSNLTTVTFGENSQLASIGSYAFPGCSSLTSINIPDSVTTIGECAFYSCSNLTTVTFGENSRLASIGSYAFPGCSSLTSINIPDSVTTIGESAFYECSNLTIYCEASSAPSGWSSSWNSSDRPVVWNCTYDEYLEAIA
ncbi:MAG: leucine-rich repeat domain-containing protein [Firmicutes bacterium]|uniref:Leucine-rich repeat domain-containing protein n=1 Tax=Candidatus Alloenteromonas pullistercoris TaxID=2840785 RepID=A0A9D9GWA9_9FIRM|nr:leucine-rich repeat domain-containing protein [Candidatus Enteromonas pullistercoris]